MAVPLENADCLREVRRVIPLQSPVGKKRRLFPRARLGETAIVQCSITRTDIAEARGVVGFIPVLSICQLLNISIVFSTYNRVVLLKKPAHRKLARIVERLCQ